MSVLSASIIKELLAFYLANSGTINASFLLFVSEILSLNPKWKSNGLIQLVFGGLRDRAKLATEEKK